MSASWTTNRAGLPSVDVLYEAMTSSAIFLAVQAGALTLHTFSSSWRSCLITCSSFSLLRNVAPHLLPLIEATSNRVGDLVEPRGGSYWFQCTPCWATGRPI